MANIVTNDYLMLIHIHEYLDTFNKEGKEAYKTYTDAYKMYKKAKQDVDYLTRKYV